MKRILDVYLLDKKVGLLSQEDDGKLTFTYAPDYLAQQDVAAISVSMPLREEPYRGLIAQAYFSGLLPDMGARKRLASALGTSADNTFAILKGIGGDCAGALSLLPKGQPLDRPEKQTMEPLSDERLKKVLGRLRTEPLLCHEEGVRLSLAGAQDKFAVCFVDGKIALAKGGRPTTHILKLFIEGLNGSVENEIFCMKLAAKIGLRAPKVVMDSVGKTSFILVERYDRIMDEAGRTTRVHQEDFCQALSIPPEWKYEEDGGPGIAQCQKLIRTRTRRSAADLLAFQRMVIFHYLVGNADAHAKNHALLYSDAVPDLSPSYDVVCTAVYPSIAKKLAMQIGGRDIPDTIQLKHWFSLVSDTRGAQSLLQKQLQELAGTVLTNANSLVDELTGEGIAHPILKKICLVIEKRAGHILRICEKVI